MKTGNIGHPYKRIRPEMFLDKTDLSETVDIHGTECCHALWHFPRFFAVVLVEKVPFLQKRAENVNGRP